MGQFDLGSDVGAPTLGLKSVGPWRILALPTGPAQVTLSLTSPAPGSEEVAVHGQVPLEGEAGLCLCLRADEVHPAGPHGEAGAGEGARVQNGIRRL